MHKHILRVALLVGVLAWPIAVFADTPPNVTGISAHFENGQISVHWDPLEDVDSYRVYYSQKSILDNEGVYDDFITTSGKNAELTMVDIPKYPQIFIAVLAVNGDGQESSSFLEEVQLDMTGNATDGLKAEKEAPSPSRKQRESASIGLIGATPLSSNSVQLTFSTNVIVAKERAADAFTMIDNRGNSLRATRMVIEGSTVTLTTDTQFPGRHYAVRANDPVTSDPLLGPLFTIDPERNIATFSGFGGTSAPTAEAQPTEPSRTTAPTAAFAAPRKVGITKSGLADSGVPILGVMLASGAIAGWRKTRKKH